MSGQADFKVEAGTRAQAVRDKLTAQTPTSAATNARGSESLAMEVVPTVDMPHPIYIESAEGCRMRDVDGNDYIDLTMGFGPHVLGHRPKAVVDAVKRQAEQGWHFGIHNPWQEKLAALLCEAGACVERAVFCNSGTEATMYAVRAARAFTGKTKVALFDGSYHGVHDYALVKADRESPRSAPKGTVLGDGVPSAIKDETMLVLPYRDDAAFEIIRQHKDELALVMVEPVQSSNPRTDVGPFLRQLKEVCAECEVLFMLDEVITGFRLAWGGGQEYFDIAPDLATYGKALGGGFPIGAVGGRADIMQVFTGKGGPGSIFSGGTFSGNPITMAAGIAALEEMQAQAGTLYHHLQTQGDRFTEAVNGYCRERQMPAQVLNAASMFHMRFQGGQIDGWRDIDLAANPVGEREFYLHLLAAGVIVPGIHLAFFSGAHGAADVDKVIDGFQRSFDEVRADGLL